MKFENFLKFFKRYRSNCIDKSNKNSFFVDYNKQFFCQMYFTSKFQLITLIFLKFILFLILIKKIKKRAFYF